MAHIDPYWKPNGFLKCRLIGFPLKNLIPRRFHNLSEVGAQPIHLCNQHSTEQRHLGLLKDLSQ